MTLHLNLAGHNPVALLLPVGGPAGLVEREGQTAGGAQDAGELPATNEGVDEVVGVREHGSPAAKGKLVNPVDGKDVSGVEVGDATVEIGLPGVDDAAEAVGYIIICG